MSRRTIQAATLLTILVLVAVFAWGCGSGGDELTTTTGGVLTTSPSPGTTTANGLIGNQLKTSDSTPKEYIDAIAQAHPLVILFYVTAGADDAKVLASITALQPQFANYVFLLYDYKTPDSYGDLSTLLKVDYPPQLVLVDSGGYVREIWNGYVDQGTLNQSLVNLGTG